MRYLRPSWRIFGYIKVKMRKRVFGRQFKRDMNERKALFRSLMRELVLHGSIKTTEAKAKAIKGNIEKHVTKAKVKGEGALVHLQKDFTHEVAHKIIRDIAPLFADRPGGYTRIIKLGNRVKDDARVVLLQWVEDVPKTVEKVEKRKAKKAVEADKAPKAAKAKKEKKTEATEKPKKPTVKKEEAK